jgi:hypothetical protein
MELLAAADSVVEKSHPIARLYRNGEVDLSVIERRECGSLASRAYDTVSPCVDCVLVDHVQEDSETSPDVEKADAPPLPFRP